jgi:FkbM family methyltransferase
MIKILDIGGRYGVHPSFSEIEKISNIYLFEPEAKEFTRLKKKYCINNSVCVENLGLTNEVKSGQRDILNITNHTGLSSVKDRNLEISINISEEASKILERQEIQLISGDQYCKEKGIEPDFIKIDVEGMEIDVLDGLKHSLSKSVGIRCEVSFDDIFFSGEPQFNKISDLLFRHNFKLLNFDYEGKGNSFSRYIDPCKKYGILQSTDAVWIKNPFNLEKYYRDDLMIAKAIIFAYINNSVDLSISLLEKINMRELRENNQEIYQFIKKIVVNHFYKIRWVPSINQAEVENFYEKIFEEKLPKYSQFNESTEFNP